jgi:hypothetical protein
MDSGHPRVNCRQAMNCQHDSLVCLNHYDLIRKSRCEACGEVMMCACDREIGEKYLSHQLRRGHDYENRQEFPVTLGFQPRVCNECRGLPVPNFPMAAIYGRTSKIARYYWREIEFELLRRLDEQPGTRNPSLTPARREEIEKAVMAEFTERHARNPKYDFLDQSQTAVIEATKTEVISIAAKHVPQPGHGVLIETGNGLVSPEKFAEQYFSARGYECILCESRPFHALFGVYMFLLIQDPDDPRNRIVGFGSRTAYDRKIKAEPIRMLLPEDFGAPGYFTRRRKQIGRHLATLDDSDWLFDYWARCSEEFREYIWAHDPADVATARRIRSILGLATLRKVLVYLVRHYWHHYCGWPDLLVFGPGEFFFVEVKSSKDRLSEDQKRWILDNRTFLHFGFKIFKITTPPSQYRSDKPATRIPSNG